MTLSSTTYRNEYTGDGVLATFPYTFRILDESHLAVYVDGVLKTLTTDYSVTGVDAAGGGNVVFETASIPGSGLAVAIVRAVPQTQVTDYINGDPLDEETMETDFDKMVMLVQQLQELLDRSPKFAGGSLFKNVAFPDLVASQFLQVNAAGTALQLVSGTPSLPGATFLDGTAFQGLWYDSSTYASINAAVAAIAATEAVLVVSSAETLTANLTIPANISLVIQKGGSIIKASTYTLTINGPFWAAQHAVFSGFSSGNVTLTAVEKVIPQWWGATGDGTTDDTAAIQCALAAGKTVYFPPATYIVDNPNAVTAAIFTLQSNLEIYGSFPNSIIKIKDSPVAYYALFHKFTPVTDSINVHDMVIDHNQANDTHATSASPRMTICLNGNGLTWRHNWVKNQDCINGVDFNGTSVENVEITDNLWTNMGVSSDANDHDCSVIYTHLKSGAQARISGNIFVAGTNGHLYGARTAIETHGSNHLVTGNFIKDFRNGINITGVGLYDAQNNKASGNIIDSPLHGIILWSMQSGAHTTGYGLDGVTVENNLIRIRQTTYDYTAKAQTVGGIVFNPTNDLAMRNITIQNNTLLYDAQDITGYTDVNGTIAIGGAFNTATLGVTNLQILNNTITNSPKAAIRLSAGNHTNLQIVGNKLINCGQSLDTGGAAAYKNPVFLAMNAIASVFIFRDNLVLDTFATTRMVNAVYLNITTDCSTVLALFTGNRYLVTGATTTAFLRAVLHTTNNYIQPYEDDITNKWGTAPTKNFLIKSRMLDISNGNLWNVLATGATWTLESAAVVVGTAASGDTTPSVAGLAVLKTANGAATSITTFDDGLNGQFLIVQIQDANTTIVFNGSTTLAGNNGADFVAQAGDFLICTCTNVAGTQWAIKCVDLHYEEVPT